MISADKNKQIQELIASLDRPGLIWLKGYLEGVLSKTPEEAAPGTKMPANGKKITIAYGTESGNSKKIASVFAARAKQEGIQTKVVSLDQYRLTDLPKEEYFLTVISTQGEGEPPSSAKKFYDHIHQNGFKLPKLKYGVLALGDTSYPMFCKAGEDVDNQLDHLGAERIIDIQRCDVDFETDAQSWFNGVLQKLSGQPSLNLPAVKAVKKSTGKKIYRGEILANINLNDRGSRKQTHHIEIAAEEIQYKSGDSIGIIPHNPEHLVKAIIEHTGIDPDITFVHRDETCSAYELLHKKLNIIYLPERVISKYAAHIQKQITPVKTGLLELLTHHPVKDAAQFESFIQQLEPTTPRLYSIASSLEKFEGEVHLTVGRDAFCVAEEQKYGLCSDLLCALKPGDTIDFYVHHNDQFRLPEENKDVIMIGPGTGIAPFRAFLAERDATGAAGRNWLFFGDQHFVSDFLYQTELQQWMENGILHKLDLAFSRDQQEKIYVQDKIKKRADEFYSWLESGAVLYICGAKKMSEDVEKAILDVIRQSGKSEDAESYFNQLKESGRYLKDVY
ncbi:MAG: flavodoxin domain-containing protein [Bacteroidota bacterium]|nr:flavodoxin domain-containing protein [Bacteroidota bacterium]